jgi:hypothetical protein
MGKNLILASQFFYGSAHPRGLLYQDFDGLKYSFPGF